MKWALDQELPSTQKFVVTALADVAGDDGVCWPSVSTIARRGAVSTRTVQLARRDLIKADLVRSDAGNRGDGSTTSNRYVLSLGGGDTLSGGMSRLSGGRWHICHPWNPIRTIIDPSPPPDPTVRVLETGSGDLRKLIFPSAFTATDCAEATRQLERFPVTLAQQLLDVLDGRMQRGEIKTTPLAYLGGLIHWAKAGTFVPEVGRPSPLRVRHGSRASAKTPSQPTETSLASVPVYSDSASNPLCQRVAEIQKKVARPVPLPHPYQSQGQAQPQPSNRAPLVKPSNRGLPG